MSKIAIILIARFFLLPFSCFLSFSCLFAQPRVIINEWSQGAQAGALCQTIQQGGGEWIELLVVGPGNVNLQGYNVRVGSFKLFEFNSNPLWQAVAPGTLILVYNGNGVLLGCKDPNIPADDVNGNDCNYRLILSSSNAQLTESAYRRNWGTNASFTDFNITQPNSNRDNPTLYEGDNLVHDWDQADNLILINTRRPNAANEAVAYIGNNVAGITANANWRLTRASDYVQDVTPGEPNGGRNTNWIESMRTIIGAPSGQNASVCQNNRATINAVMGNPPGSQIQLFTQSAGGSPVATAVAPPYRLVTPIVTQVSTFYLEALDAATGCRSPRTAVSVNIIPLPGAPRAQAVTACPGQRVKLYAQMGSPAGTEIRMYLSDTATTPFARQSSAVPGLGYEFTTPPISTTTTFYLESLDAVNNCASSRTPVVVNMATVPGPPKAEDQERCGSGILTFTIAMGAPPGNRIRVFSQAQGGTPLLVLNRPPYTFTTPPLDQTTTFYLESIDTLAGCPSMRLPITAVINPPPAAPTADTARRCGRGKAQIEFFAPAPDTGVLLFYDRPAGGNLINRKSGGPNFLIETPELSTSAVFYGALVSAATGCTSARSPASVIILPLPGPPQAAATPVCLGETTVFTLAFSSPAGTHIWVYDQEDANFPIREFAAPPFEFTVQEASLGKNYYFEVYDSLSGCPSQRIAVPVPLKPIPSPPAIGQVSRCGAGDIKLNSSVVDFGNVIRLYARPSGGQPLIIDDEPPFTFSLSINTTSTFYLDVLDTEGGCFSLRVPATIIIHPLPQITAPEEIARCGPGPLAFTLSAGGADRVRIFTQATGAAPLLSFETSPEKENTLTLPNITRSSLYFIEGEISATGCKNTREPLTVLIYPVPAKAGSRSFTRCGQGIISFFAPPTDGVTTRVKLQTDSQTVARADQDPWELKFSAATSGIYFIINTDTATGCQSPADTVAIRVLPLPNAPKAEPIIRCGAGKVVFTVLQTEPRGNELQLYTVPSGGSPIATLAMPATDTILFLTPEVTTATTFYLTALSYVTGCQAPRDTLPVQISATLAVAVRATPATNGLNGVIRVSASGGVPPYTFSLGGPFIEDSVFAALTPGTYQVWVKDAGACLSQTAVVVDNIPERCDTPAPPETSVDALGNVTVVWLPIPGAIRYELQYRLAGTQQWQNTISTIDTRIILASLEENQYEMRLRAVCASVPSNYIEATFSSRLICKAANLNILNVRANSANLLWSAEGNPGLFEIRFKPSAAGNWQMVTTSASTLTLENLQPNTMYDVCVRALCQSLRGEEVCSFFRTAEGAACPSPLNPFISEVTTRTAIYTWSQVEGANSYMMRYRIVGSNSWIFENARPPHLFRNLQSGTTYEVQVRAICGSSASGWSAPLTFTTIETRRQSQESLALQPVAYPNPTRDVLYLQGLIPGGALTVFDINGKVMLPSLPIQEEAITLDLSRWANGWYILRLSYNGVIQTLKALKQE
jgi:hypothetical protein